VVALRLFDKKEFIFSVSLSMTFARHPSTGAILGRRPSGDFDEDHSAATISSTTMLLPTICYWITRAIDIGTDKQLRLTESKWRQDIQNTLGIKGSTSKEDGGTNNFVTLEVMGLIYWVITTVHGENFIIHPVEWITLIIDLCIGRPEQTK
jgi:hypothetical protein